MRLRKTFTMHGSHRGRTAPMRRTHSDRYALNYAAAKARSPGAQQVTGSVSS